MGCRKQLVNPMIKMDIILENSFRQYTYTICIFHLNYPLVEGEILNMCRPPVILSSECTYLRRQETGTDHSKTSTPGTQPLLLSVGTQLLVLKADSVIDQSGF